MQGIGRIQGFNSFDRRVFSNKNAVHVVIAAGVLALGATAGVWRFYSPPSSTQKVETAANPSAAQESAAKNPYSAFLVGLGRPERAATAFLAKPVPANSTPRSAPPALAVLPPPRPEEHAVVATVVPEGEIVAEVETAPLPPRRPTELANRAPALTPLRRVARADNTSVVPAAPTDNRSIFERFFGMGGNENPAPQPTTGRRATNQALAYAAPEGALQSAIPDVSRSAVAPAAPAARYDRYTAIYDISAHTVYMPNGARLEAHSGLREHLDDPRFVHLRMRGATPPNVYALTPREALFHGVEALRLTPIGGGTFGRAGLLAHTYMLGPNGDSNGCVSFRDYHAFLQAYKSGEVRRLVVVARMN